MTCKHKLNVLQRQDSIYGKRDRAISGLAVVHSDRANIFRKSALWKQGVVDSFDMLGRSSMFKPEVHLLIFQFSLIRENPEPSMETT